MMLFVKLLLAHLLGDFVFQSQKRVNEKESGKIKSTWLYLHGFIHFILITIALTGHSGFLWIAGLVAISHIVIDMLKLQFQTEKYRRLFFFADQVLHLLVISAVAYFDSPAQIKMDDKTINQLLILITGIVILLTPSSVVVKLFLSKWAPATEIKSDKIETQSLQHAGMMIGFLERLLVFIFIIAGQWSAIGFLVTAKSVFRFSDLKIGQDRKLTEYILIGTLSSFGIAIVTGMVTAFLLKI